MIFTDIANVRREKTKKKQKQKTKMMPTVKSDFLPRVRGRKWGFTLLDATEMSNWRLPNSKGKYDSRKKVRAGKL